MCLFVLRTLWKAFCQGPFERSESSTKEGLPLWPPDCFAVGPEVPSNMLKPLRPFLRWTGVALLAALPSFGANTQVGLELSLLVDVSGSVDATEFNLQRSGYVQAFQSAAVQNAILGSTNGSIAVNLIYWSGAGEQSTAVGFTLINSVASANAFAAAINATARPFSGSTAPGSAINFAVPLFSSNLFDAPRQVIDVSGDGAENDGANTLTARNNALAAGIDTINGLPILGEAGLLAFYQNNIQGGAGSFTTAAANFAAFATAIENKLVTEINNTVPEPASIVFLLSAMGLTGLVARRRQVRG